MKIGFYDSGLGGLSVLREFKQRYQHDYIYLGDSARAPYGTKTPEDLINCVYEILDFMQERGVDLVVSACNTSSMHLDSMNLSKYSFKVISLFETMKLFFAAGTVPEAALLATPSTITSKRYLEWNCNIEAIACPDLVPLVEAGDLSAAHLRFQEYLAGIKSPNVIVGCTHYSFLLPIASEFSFIDPAVVVAEQFRHPEHEVRKIPSSQQGGPSLRSGRHTAIYCTGDPVIFNRVLHELLGNELSASPVVL